jgi:orotidine 5'-phosphate decarboxylase subfamily 1
MSPTPASPPPARTRLTYAARIPHAVNPASRALLRIMETKQTNLCLSADVTSSARLLRLADELGPHICLLKTHVDILDDWDASVVSSLRTLARRHNFLLFEDRKYADIGSTVTHQFAGGPFRAAEWSHVTNCHIVPGPGIIKGLQQAAVAATATAVASGGGESTDEEDRARGLLLIAEMSSAGSLAVGDYTAANVRLAESEEHSAFVMGFICQHRLSDRPGLLHLSPGVQLPPAGVAAVSSASSSGSTGGDSLGQQYHSPSSIIGTQGSDIIIVGRAIIAADDPRAEARRYQQAGWQAYLDAVGKE